MYFKTSTIIITKSIILSVEYEKQESVKRKIVKISIHFNTKNNLQILKNNGVKKNVTININYI